MSNNFTMSDDDIIKLEYNETINKYPFDKIQIGAGGAIDIPDAPDGHSDINSVYVSSTGDDANAGTFASPVLTLTKAMQICDYNGCFV